MRHIIRKQLHQHGGSKAVDLPMSFIKGLGSNYVTIEEKNGYIAIYPDSPLAGMESDPLFAHFLNTLLTDALKNPSELKDMKEVWDKEWEELLRDVPNDEE